MLHIINLTLQCQKVKRRPNKEISAEISRWADHIAMTVTNISITITLIK